MKDHVIIVISKFHKNAIVVKMNTPLHVEVRERSVAKFVVQLLIVESTNVKEDAMRDLVLLAQKIQKE